MSQLQGISRSLIGQSRSHKVFQFPYDFEDYFLMIKIHLFFIRRPII